MIHGEAILISAKMKVSIRSDTWRKILTEFFSQTIFQKICFFFVYSYCDTKHLKTRHIALIYFFDIVQNRLDALK